MRFSNCDFRTNTVDTADKTSYALDSIYFYNLVTADPRYRKPGNRQFPVAAKMPHRLFFDVSFPIKKGRRGA
jgi:hypothetical protein